MNTFSILASWVKNSVSPTLPSFLPQVSGPSKIPTHINVSGIFQHYFAATSCSRAQIVSVVLILNS